MVHRFCHLAAVAAILCVFMLQGCRARNVESVSESGNVIVTEPHPGDTVSSPITLSGRARVFEATLNARVIAESGSELGATHFMTDAGAPEFGEFDAAIDFTKPPGVSRGFVEVFDYSAKDGSVQDLVRIPVGFR